jgi:Cu/Ag efflux protein CusF
MRRHSAQTSGRSEALRLTVCEFRSTRPVFEILSVNRWFRAHEVFRRKVRRLPGEWHHCMRGTTMSKSLTLAALLGTLSLAALAGAQEPNQANQPKKVTKENQVTATATIKAIDRGTRTVTLRAENGDEDTFKVGPDVTRFDELKVGDTIRATYYESLVFQVRKPGASTATSGAVAAGGRLKDVPGGAIGTQETTTVTVKAVDMNAPSITVVTADGRTLTRKIADKKNLEGVNPGDKIEITYTQGLVVSAEATKK